MRRSVILAYSLVLGCGAPAASDAGTADAAAVEAGADAGPIDCTGNFGPGVIVFAAAMYAVSPAVTGDELSLFYFTGLDMNVFEAMRPSTGEMFSGERVVLDATDVCLHYPHPQGIDVSMDGLRLYVSCDGALHVYARQARDASAPFVHQGIVAMGTSMPAVTTDELEIYDLDTVDLTSIGRVVHASRASLADPFPTLTVLAGPPGNPDLSSPDISPDGLTLFTSTPRGGSDTDRMLVSFTRASRSDEFESSVEIPLGVEGTMNASHVEISASCRSLYFAAGSGPTSGVHVYVARR